MPKKTAIIIGAGPAGLTAGYELLSHTDYQPIILESSDAIGGLSRTVKYKGNGIDIGGHRFFSKSDRVTKWWLNLLSLQGAPSRDDLILKRHVPLSIGGPDPENADNVMLVRSRLSRILFKGRFFDYPVSLSLSTLKNLGLLHTLKIGLSYIHAKLFHRNPEITLEDFFINRFGVELYQTFFKDYTEKVWGISCKNISSEWGKQRIKGLSITTALMHSLKKVISRSNRPAQVETSLIGEFMYPKLGPGQLWEEAAKRIVARGGSIKPQCTVTGFTLMDNKIKEVLWKDQSGSTTKIPVDCVFSSMPIKDLIAALGSSVPEPVAKIAAGLQYRDFIMVGVLADAMEKGESNPVFNGIKTVSDNWIYIQESYVKMGRLQIYNNWSPYMVSQPDKVWIGVEYFCQENDAFWNLPDAKIAEFAVKELENVHLVNKKSVRDQIVLRAPKAYPAYFGTYNQFPVVRNYLNTISNLFPIGRNGMHKYNNMDHSMLSAMTAVELATKGIINHDSLWDINTEDVYHETK